MLSMAYTAARDSQEGVLCKLLDELRDNATKEAALALTALLALTMSDEHHTDDSISSSGSSSSWGPDSSSSRGDEGFSMQEVDAASEAFLERRFGLQVRRRGWRGCMWSPLCPCICAPGVGWQGACNGREGAWLTRAGT